MESGNKKHRYTYSGGVKAVEEQKYGRAKAVERYGTPQHLHGAPPPKDTHGPQFDKQGPKYANDTSGWLRGAGKGGEGKPGYGKSRPREK
jgi:hypothetical protein